MDSTLNVCSCTHKRREHDGSKNISDRRVFECRIEGCKCTKYSSTYKGLTPVAQKELITVMVYIVIAFIVSVGTYLVLDLSISSVTDYTVAVDVEELTHVNDLINSAVTGEPLSEDTVKFFKELRADKDSDSALLDIDSVGENDVPDAIIMDSSIDNLNDIPATTSLVVAVIIVYIGLGNLINENARKEEIML